MNGRRKFSTWSVYVLFIVSGGTGLAYEVIWTRHLVRIFGATSFAVTTVLASFMAGLALGSYIFGKYIDRRGNPVRTYGLLEFGIGLFALAFPFLLHLLSGAYGWLYSTLRDEFYLLTAARVLLSFAILLIPTTLMGGTLPVLSKFVVRQVSSLSGKVGSLYAVNTLGAVVGAFGTGFFLLPKLGMRTTTLVCVVANFIIFGLALWLGRASHRVKQHQAAVATRGKERWEYVVLLSFLVTGFCALSIEVLWTRVLVLVIGTTVYAFSTMLTTFLLGLGIGSAIFARVAQRVASPGRVLSLLVGAIGVSVFLSSVGFGKFPFLYMELYERLQPDWSTVIWIQFLFCFLIMFIPTLLMGGVFPLVARLYARRISTVGCDIGTVYAFNTIGSVGGSVAGSFIFLRFFGIENSLSFVAGIYVIVSLVLLLSVAEFRRHTWRLVSAILVIGLAVVVYSLSPAWDKVVMTSGVYRYAPSYSTVEGLRKSLRKTQTLFYEESPGATVSVARTGNEIALLINGKGDASTDIGDMTTQVLLAQLPLVFHPHPDTVLVIGLGSGVTVGSAAQHEVSLIDCVELLEGVVRASSFFRAKNYDCLSDPRVRLIIGDGRNHMILGRQKYDVIISEPTNPWVSGVGDLFTLEFFRAMRSRLKPDGIACVWLHIYEMGEEDVKCVARTLLTEFPEVSLWLLNSSDIIFLASNKPVVFDRDALGRVMQPKVVSDLRRIWINTPPDLACFFLAGTRGLRKYSTGVDRLHTDDNLALEFSAGRQLLESTTAIHLKNFLEIAEALPLEGIDEETKATISLQTKARRLAIEAMVAEASGKIDDALYLLDMAHSLAPNDPFVLVQYTSTFIEVGNKFITEADKKRSLEAYLKALDVPDYAKGWRALHGLGLSHILRREYEEARKSFLLALEKNPYSADSYYQLGNVEMLLGRRSMAIEAYKKTLRLQPAHFAAANALSRIYAEAGENLDEALRLANTAVSLEQKPKAFNALGWVYYRKGDIDRARDAFEHALRIDPNDTEALYRLAALEVVALRKEKARELLERLSELGKNDIYSQRGRKLLREIR